MHIQPYSNDPWDKHKRKNPWDIGTTPDEDKHKKWQMETKKIVTIADLFPRLDRLSIGWSPILDQLRKLLVINQPILHMILFNWMMRLTYLM